MKKNLEGCKPHRRNAIRQALTIYHLSDLYINKFCYALITIKANCSFGFRTPQNKMLHEINT